MGNLPGRASISETRSSHSSQPTDGRLSPIFQHESIAGPNILEELLHEALKLQLKDVMLRLSGILPGKSSHVLMGLNP